jgi:hypothetical protein
LATPEWKLVKEGLPVAVETHDLAVEDDRLLQFGADGFAQCAERLELATIPRDELAPSVLDRARARKPSFLISNSQS